MSYFHSYHAHKRGIFNLLHSCDMLIIKIITQLLNTQRPHNQIKKNIFEIRLEQQVSMRNLYYLAII